MNNTDVHTSHCCAFHGCKYADSACTVVSLKKRQEYPCEHCSMGGYDIHRFDPAGVVWSLDFLSFDLLTVDDIPAVLTKARELLWMSVYAETEGASERVFEVTKAFPPEHQKAGQILACAFKYTAWLYAHMFATKWERV